ncbi:hypothetical protein EMCRGX_G032303 [Ephydatia muelleri]
MSTNSTRTYRDFLTGPTVRIGCSSGFWGDTVTSAPQLVGRGGIDFLVADYLSEITMSLLATTKQKFPHMGYTPDFLQNCMKPLLKEIKSKACSEALAGLAKEQGVELNIATVTGDDLMDQLHTIHGKSDEGRPMYSAVQSMNASFPIAKALDHGADVVVTGRCVDSALTLGPLIHKVERDLDQLAAGSLAGHLVECGAQVTGGIFTDWSTIHGWDDIGFPIIECDRSGQFIVTKPTESGGRVSIGTVSEQLVYEIGDPSAYLLPDVTCDFTNVCLEEVQEDVVLVKGARGKSAPQQYKVTATCADGYRALAVCPVVGPNAAQKARKTAEAILKRTRNMFDVLQLGDYSQTHIQILGTESSYGHHAQSSLNPREVVLWLGVRHKQKAALEVFAREIAPAGTGMAPGLTGLVGGRPKVSPVLRLHSFLYPRKELSINILMNGKLVEKFTSEAAIINVQYPETVVSPPTSAEPVRGDYEYRVEELAYLRSGDKGDTVNIGVVARNAKALPYLREQLTTHAVKDYFAHLLETNSTVERYELPGIGAINFVITKALGGGGCRLYDATLREEALKLRKEYVASTLSLHYSTIKPLKILYGRGQYLYDENEQPYLDCINNVTQVGHCHPKVVEAFATQAAQFSSLPFQSHDLYEKYTKRLLKSFQNKYDFVFYVHSGSEANDLAMQIAEAYTGHTEVIVIEGAYHGHTVPLMGLSSYKAHQVTTAGSYSKNPHAWIVPCPDPYQGKYRDPLTAGRLYAEEVKKVLDEMKEQGTKVASFLCESFPGCAGQVKIADGYFKTVFKYVHSAGGLCILDEVQTGFGRAGDYFWIFESQGVWPDIVTIGKPMGNGHPIAAVVTSKKIAKAFAAANNVKIFEEYGADPVSLAVADAVMTVIEEESLQKHAKELGSYIMDGFLKLSKVHPCIGDVRGFGLFIGVEIVKDPLTREPDGTLAKTIVSRAMMEYKIIVMEDGLSHNVIKVKPPLCFTRENADSLLRAFDEILSELGK